MAKSSKVAVVADAVHTKYSNVHRIVAAFYLSSRRSRRIFSYWPV